MSLYQGFMHLSAGLAVGLSGLAAGFAIGIVGDSGVRGASQQPRLYMGMVSCFAVVLCAESNGRVILIGSDSHLCRSSWTVRYALLVFLFHCHRLVLILIIRCRAHRGFDNVLQSQSTLRRYLHHVKHSSESTGSVILVRQRVCSLDPPPSP